MCIRDRISTLNLKDPDHYMASENVFDVAKKLGYWDGKEPFKFWKAYSGKNYSGQLKSFSTREHFILNALAPSLKLEDVYKRQVNGRRYGMGESE